MPLRLKTKLTLTTALLVLGVVAVGSTLFLANSAKQVIEEAGSRARFVAQNVFLQAQHAITDAAETGAAPASETPEDLRAFVKQAMDEHAGLTTMIDSSVGYAPSIYEVSIVDHNRVVLISSDPALPGRPAFVRPPLERLAGYGFFDQLRLLYGPPRVYEIRYPFDLAGQPFGEIRVALSTALLRNEIAPKLQTAAWLALGFVLVSTLLAALLSHISLRPLARISDQLDRIARGEFDPAAAAESHRTGFVSGDELGQVSAKVSRIGEQLRGVQEIFGTLRENMDQLMAGLDDGLILFTRDARAVLVSPSVVKFLGVPREELLGKRVGEIFPPGHPVQVALGIQENKLGPVEGAEVRLGPPVPGPGRRKRVSRMSVSVHVIAERGPDGTSRFGALMALRDLDSLEQLGSHLQTSERLSALGRVTAGVAHEVKNPLNSMRLWLENLKQGLPASAAGDPAGQGMAQQAVHILDSEIDRLDRVVKTFLDFTRPVEPEFTEVALPDLLAEVAAIARPQCQRSGAEIVVAAVQPLAIRADRQLLKQALLNLVLNAAQALQNARARSAPGRIELAAELRGEHVEIRVADNGPGIPPDLREKVFQLFFTTRKGGTGIGLATAFRIVQLHEGSIYFTTEPARGTTFRISLPASRWQARSARSGAGSSAEVETPAVAATSPSGERPLGSPSGKAGG